MCYSFLHNLSVHVMQEAGLLTTTSDFFLISLLLHSSRLIRYVS